jgi:hypothetical protein
LLAKLVVSLGQHDVKVMNEFII